LTGRGDRGSGGDDIIKKRYVKSLYRCIGGEGPTQVLLACLLVEAALRRCGNHAPAAPLGHRQSQFTGYAAGQFQGLIETPFA
jgi:hypothetical protein